MRTMADKPVIFLGDEYFFTLTRSASRSSDIFIMVVNNLIYQPRINATQTPLMLCRCAPKYIQMNIHLYTTLPGIIRHDQEPHCCVVHIISGPATAFDAISRALRSFAVVSTAHTFPDKPVGTVVVPSAATDVYCRPPHAPIQATQWSPVLPLGTSILILSNLPLLGSAVFSTTESAGNTFPKDWESDPQLDTYLEEMYEYASWYGRSASRGAVEA